MLEVGEIGVGGADAVIDGSEGSGDISQLLGRVGGDVDGALEGVQLGGNGVMELRLGGSELLLHFESHAGDVLHAGWVHELVGEEVLRLESHGLADLGQVLGGGHGVQARGTGRG